MYDPSNFWKTCNGLFITLNVIVAILWIVKCYVNMQLNQSAGTEQLNYQANQGFQNWYTDRMFDYIYIYLDLWSNFMFFFLLVMTGYWFVFFKLQKRSFVLLPSQEDTFSQNYIYFNKVFFVVFGFKLASIFQTIRKQCQIDIFLIDWEKMKEMRLPVNEHGQVIDPGISIWRTLFVANEYNELQVTRVVSLEWTLFILGLIMTGLNLD